MLWKQRLNITYQPCVGEPSPRELPFIIAVLGNFSGHKDRTPLHDRPLLLIDHENFDEVLASLDIEISFRVPNCLTQPTAKDDTLPVNIRIAGMTSFHPDQFIQQIPPVTEAIEVQRQLTETGKDCSEIKAKIGMQLDEILHHSDFQSMESAWTGLKLLVDGTNFRENIKIILFNCSKEDLHTDFKQCSNMFETGLYQAFIRTHCHGSGPLGAIIANYYLGPGTKDMALMRNIAAFSALAKAPCITSASPELLGLDNFSRLPTLDLPLNFLHGPAYAEWQAFRESEEARFISLTLPCFLGRLPYGPGTNPVKAIPYQEYAKNQEDYLWCNTAFALGARFTDSFARYRLINFAGPHLGKVADLPVYCHTVAGSTVRIGPTEAIIPDRREFELSEEGFLTLTPRKQGSDAIFLSANSVQKPGVYDMTAKGREAESRHKCGMLLPYLFLACRFFHYLDVMAREAPREPCNATYLQQRFTAWIQEFAIPTDYTPRHPRPCPLFAAEINVEAVDDYPSRFNVRMSINPNLKYMGNHFTLHLSGTLITNP